MNPEFDRSNKFESEHTRQVEKLPGILGYNPAELDPQLPELRAGAVNAMAEKDWDTIGPKIAAYQEVADRIVGKYRGEDYTKAQIGLAVDRALMWLEANNIDRYGTEIWDARNYARNKEYSDITEILNPAWDEVVNIQLASENWQPLKTTAEMVQDGLEHFPAGTFDEIREEIKARTNLSPTSFLADMVNVLTFYVVYGQETPLETVIKLGWVEG
jgi:hypothetical protein